VTCPLPVRRCGPRKALDKPAVRLRCRSRDTPQRADRHNPKPCEKYCEVRHKCRSAHANQPVPEAVASDCLPAAIRGRGAADLAASDRAPLAGPVARGSCCRRTVRSNSRINSGCVCVEASTTPAQGVPTERPARCVLLSAQPRGMPDLDARIAATADGVETRSNRSIWSAGSAPLRGGRWGVGWAGLCRLTRPGSAGRGANRCRRRRGGGPEGRGCFACLVAEELAECGRVSHAYACCDRRAGELGVH
jgi:hypothetical protein